MKHAWTYVKAADGGYTRVLWIGSGPQRTLIENDTDAPIQLWTGQRLEPGARLTVAQCLTAATPPAETPREDLAPGRRPRLDIFEEPGQ